MLYVLSYLQSSALLSSIEQAPSSSPVRQVERERDTEREREDSSRQKKRKKEKEDKERVHLLFISFLLSFHWPVRVRKITSDPLIH